MGEYSYSREFGSDHRPPVRFKAEEGNWNPLGSVSNRGSTRGGPETTIAGSWTSGVPCTALGAQAMKVRRTAIPSAVVTDTAEAAVHILELSLHGCELGGVPGDKGLQLVQPGSSGGQGTRDGTEGLEGGQHSGEHGGVDVGENPR